MSVSGTVSGVAPGAEVSVHIRSEMDNEPFTVSAGKDGSFSAADLAPGTYYIYAESGEGEDKWRSAERELELKSDASNIILGVARPVNITGKLTGAPHAIVHLEAGGWEDARRFTAAISADGTFHFDQVPPDRYTLSISAAPEDAYIRTVELNGTVIDAREAGRDSGDDATAPAFAVHLDLASANGTADLKIVLAPGARISGTVQGTLGPLTDGLSNVELVAEEKRSEWLMCWPGKDGAYVFHSIPPGKYRIFARHSMESEGIDFRKMVDGAELIELHEGERVTKDLNVVEAPGDGKQNP